MLLLCLGLSCYALTSSNLAVGDEGGTTVRRVCRNREAGGQIVAGRPTREEKGAGGEVAPERQVDMTRC